MSGYIPDRVLEEVRFRNDIVEVIQSYMPLKRAGATYKACCPFHKEKTPSFNVNPNLQIFKCFGCGEGGDVISFVMKHQGLDFMSAVRMLAERAGVTIETEAASGEVEHRQRLLAIHEGLAGFYRRCLEQFAGGAAARDYLAQRKLDDETGAAFGIGYAPAGWDKALRWGEKNGYAPDLLLEAGVVLHNREKDRYYDRFRDRLMFPIRDVQGRVVGFSARLLAADPKQPKYVNSPETVIFNKGRLLFGLDVARQQILQMSEREALIVEGQVDVIRCHQFGFGRAVAAQGTAFTEEHVALLKRYADSAVMVYDADGAGQAAALKTAQALMRVGFIVRVAVLPPGDDPDSYLLREGKEAFERLLQQAGTTVAFQIAALSAGEKDVRSLAVTSRIAKAVLETIACSPDAVQRARLLQEAGSLLGLPEAVLLEDLQRLERDRRQQEQRYARHRGEGRSVEGGEGEPSQGGPLPARASSEPARKPSAAGIPLAEKLFVRLLAEAQEGDPALDLAREYVPLVLIRHPVCRALVGQVLAGSAGAGADAEMAGRIGKLRAHLEALPVSLEGEERLRALQDAILKLWRTHLEQERRALMMQPGYAQDQDAFLRCSQIGHDLDTLRHWEHGQDVILAEAAMLADSPAALPLAGAETEVG